MDDDNREEAACVKKDAGGHEPEGTPMDEILDRVMRNRHVDRAAHSFLKARLPEARKAELRDARTVAGTLLGEYRLLTTVQCITLETEYEKVDQLLRRRLATVADRERYVAEAVRDAMASLAPGVEAPSKLWFAVRSTALTVALRRYLAPEDFAALFAPWSRASGGDSPT